MIPLSTRKKESFAFRAFLEMGQEESASPFLNKRGQRIARHLHLKVALFAGFLLLCSVLTSSLALSEILLVAVYTLAGAPLLIQSIEDLFCDFDVNIDVLMTIAAFAAYFIGARYEGALLLVLFEASHSLEDFVTLKAKNALKHIHMIVPTKAVLLGKDGQTREIAIEDVKIGAKILVRAGEIVPLDSRVLAGSAFVDLKHLTGESKPIRKREHDEVVAGARVQDAALTLEVLHTSQESAVQKLVELITKAEESKPKLERWFDKFSRCYALTIICVSVISAVVFWFQGLPLFQFEGAIYRALSFLIAASPCALVLAVPIAYLSALGASAKRGAVLKGGVVLDQLNASSIIAFDKTGTLTLGELELDECIGDNSCHLTEPELMKAAASLERNATHPIAKAISKKFEQDTLYPTSAIRVIPGVGVEGTVTIGAREFPAFIGDVERADTLLEKEAAHKIKKLAAEKNAEGKVTAFFSLHSYGFLLSFTDHPRPQVRDMLTRLKSKGKRLLMLTGDNSQVAEAIAKAVGITEVHANAKPEEKLRTIEELSSKFGLAMVGDGVNDAPALARATVGIAMGQMGSQITQEVADCILLNDNIELLDWLFDKAEKTKKIVRQNVGIALTAILGASVPALMGYVPLWMAVILHEGGTVLVALNATRLLRR